MQRFTQVVGDFRRLKKDTGVTGSLSTWGKSRLVKLRAEAKLRKLTQCPGMSH